MRREPVVLGLGDRIPVAFDLMQGEVCAQHGQQPAAIGQRFLRLHHLGKVFVLQFLQLQEHTPQILLDRLLLNA
jgi:hypothetical protein